MQYRIQFLAVRANVIRELTADARSAASAIEFVVNRDWPPRAVTTRVLDVDGREVHSKVKGDSRDRCRAPAVRGSSVCRMRGASGGAPRGNRNALRHGGSTGESLALKSEIQALARLARETMAAIE
jgi:hypothetical protein